MRSQYVCFDEYLCKRIGHDAEFVPNKILTEGHWQYDESFEIEGFAVATDDSLISRIAYRALVGESSIHGVSNEIGKRAEICQNQYG